jgi:peptide/nickel transport system substrate-binding protein
LRVLAVTIACFAMIATAFAGLGLNASAASTGSGTFVYAKIGEPDTIDPAIDYEDSGWEILQNVYETLIWYDGPSAVNLVPLLTTQVPSVDNGLISRDGMRYTFHLKAGVTFHDGTVMNADDVVYSIQRVLRMHDPSGMAWMLEQVMTDTLSYYLGDTVASYLALSHRAPWILDILLPLGEDHIITEEDITAVAQAAVLKIDDMTVAFRLTHPYPGFLYMLATTVGSIMSMEFVEAHGGVVNGQWNDFMAMNECGSGPYKLADWSFGSSITLTRFESYHGRLPTLKTVMILTVNEVSERLLMLEAGDADAIYLPPSLESEVAGSPDIWVVKGFPRFIMTFIEFNFHIDSATANSLYGTTVTDDFFCDVHMRRAFSHLVDAVTINQEVYFGNAMQPNGPIPMGMFGYDSSAPVYAYDLEMAKTELQLAINPHTGNSWWDDGFAIPLFFNMGNIYRQTVCEQIKVALESMSPKLTAVVVGLDWPVYLQQFYSTYSYFPMFVTGWAVDYADPDDFATSLLDSNYGGYPFYSGYENPAVNDLVRQAASERYPAVREGLYSQLAILVYDDVPYVWLAQMESFFVQRSWVRGYYFNPMYGGLYYAALWKEVPTLTVTKLAGAPAKSAVSWTVQPTAGDALWSAEINNNGLKTLMLEVYDLTTGKKVSQQKIFFGPAGAYPTGIVYSEPVPVVLGHSYKVVATPNGKIGSSAEILNHIEYG